MPGSLPENKYIVVNWFNEIKPRLILDIGPGKGTYSMLLRKCKPIEDIQKWTCVEIFEPYIEKYDLKSKYEHIINTDIKIVDFNVLPKYDLIIAGDILEHLEKSEAICLIERLKKHTKNLIVSIPIVDYPQGPSEGNIYESHLCSFTHEEMDILMQSYRKLTGETLGYYWWKEPWYKTT